MNRGDKRQKKWGQYDDHALTMRLQHDQEPRGVFGVVARYQRIVQY